MTARHPPASLSQVNAFVNQSTTFPQDFTSGFLCSNDLKMSYYVVTVLVHFFNNVSTVNIIAFDI